MKKVEIQSAVPRRQSTASRLGKLIGKNELTPDGRGLWTVGR